MFERFTERARRSVVLAQDEARLLGHDRIGTEHILLGILRDGSGVAASALISLGVTLESARAQLGGAGGLSATPSGHIPFSAPAKRSLEHGLREALQLGSDYIGTEHILLGLIRDDTSTSAQTLAGLGVPAPVVRRRVIELLPGRATRRALAPVRVASTAGAAGGGPAGRLDSLALRLSAVEEHAGMTPDLTALDADLAHARGAKEAAIDAHDFRRAEELSERETGLLLDRDALMREWAARPSLAAQLTELRAEVARLRAELERLGARVHQPGGEAADRAG